MVGGFTTAAAIQIASSQIKGLLGLTGKADGFLGAWISVFKNIHQIRLWDSVLGITSIIALVGMRVCLVHCCFDVITNLCLAFKGMGKANK